MTGGLAGDGDRFEQTLVRWGTRARAGGMLVGIGFYGDRLRVGYGSLGGWDPFGPERRITRSRGNVLYELDGRPALELYRLYLGEHAAGLPATGLLFPLSLRAAEGGAPASCARSSASTRRERQPDLRRRRPGGAARPADEGEFRPPDRRRRRRRGDAAARGTRRVRAELALLISCVGRKMILKQRVEEEVEGVARGPRPRAAR